MGDVSSNGQGYWMTALLLTAASDPRGVLASCELLRGSFCSVVAWPRSLFASADAAGATVDIYTSSCTPLVQLSSGLNVPNHSGHARNSLPVFSLPIKGAALCHVVFALLFHGNSINLCLRIVLFLFLN